MSLHSTAMLTTQATVRQRILSAADGLDQTLRLTRDAVFGLEPRLRGQGLRAEIIALCEGMPESPEVSFTGPVDGALDPVRAARLAQTLKDAVRAVTQHSAPSRIVVTAGESACTAEIETATALPDTGPPPAWPAELSHSAAEAGIELTINSAAGGTRFTWSMPLRGEIAEGR